MLLLMLFYWPRAHPETGPPEAGPGQEFLYVRASMRASKLGRRKLILAHVHEANVRMSDYGHGV